MRKTRLSNSIFYPSKKYSPLSQTPITVEHQGRLDPHHGARPC
jgi:hypothetical protein